ncbi:MAG TPA: IPT/TIG domain-containing protein [Thermoanaerobaculia bacterium]|nr:IPT/TIG domain-containing protein [Thermoanaerobaculia bacterium]HQN06486.1 IPT/TIG domain-containing protein [Thermoanaerobaculia bacterium]HQP84848.1 IPT/TIG domain-containing protein [Thermoanaerobaculia bacterium]
MRLAPLAALALLGLGLTPAAVAEGPFRPIDSPAEAAGLPQTTIRSTAVRPFAFDARLFAVVMRTVASEAPSEVGTPSTLLELPHPDGGLEQFRVIESPVMAPELATKFPEIRTYRGVGVDDPTASVRFEVSPRGFSAMVLSAAGAWYVDPWTKGVVDVVGSYHRRDALRGEGSPFECQAPGTPDDGEGPGTHEATTDLGPTPFPLASVGPTLRTYRLALATTGEYSVAVCGSKPTTACVAAELVVAVNRVTGIYEREVAVRMTLIANNDLLIYLDGATDPYTNSNGGTMLGQNQSNLDSVIGSANYDFGHVFSTGGGGVAYLGVICESGWKGGGVTGQSNPTGDAFWVDYVAHEMGHQFGGNHTFNGSLGSCTGGNRNGPTAYEPGSGSTIMAYAGICGLNDLQPHSDPYFHAKSFDEITSYVSGGGASCAVSSATSNSAPAADAGAAYTIPSRTPFALTGSATDPEGDALTYGWEQLDRGTVEPAPPLVDAGNRPIFRSFNPTVSPTRIFPKLADVLSGTITYGETMPTTSRTMNFRLTARDNRGGGGGVASDATTVTTVSAAGPFAVTAPASAVIWAGGSTQTVSWNVAGTTASPISCANVSIALSTDGGQTFPATLLASTPNDGSETVTVPDTPTTGATARVRVACVGNVFFAISRPPFTIGTPPPPPTVSTVLPSSGPTAGGTTVTITGTNLGSTSAVTFGGTAATSFTVSSATQVTATTPAHAAGAVDVVVTTSGGSATSTGGFTFVAPAPTIASVAPSSGSTLGGTTVTITGANLTGASAATFGGAAATSLTVISAAQVRVTTPAHAAGAVDVAVTTPGGTATKSAGFTFVVPKPTIAAVAPASGSTLGGTVVTITGTNLSGASAVTFGGTPAASFTVDSAAQVTATTPAHVAGEVNVAVTTPGGTATRTNGFTYVSVVPAIATVAPAEGPAAGGSSVTITGTNLTGATAVSFGGSAATSFTVDSATQIRATTPAHAAGAVDVTVTTPYGDATSTNGFTYLGAPTALRFHTVTPCRIVDTRWEPDGPLAGPALQASPAERTFALVPGCGVPADALVVSANVTVTGATAAGALRVFEPGSAPTEATIISFPAGRTRANNALILVSGSGEVTVRNDADGEVHLIIDVNGYFR